MRIELPARTQAPQVEALLTELRAAPSTEPLEVDASKVTHVDTAGVQLLLALLKTRPDVQFIATPIIDAAAKTLGIELRSQP